MKKILILALLPLLVSWSFFKKEKKVDVLPEVKKILLSHNCVKYKVKNKPSNLLTKVYRGYDKSGKVSILIACREFKTYEKVTAIIALKSEKDYIKVCDAKVLDLNKVDDKEKKQKVIKALNDINGKIICKSKSFKKIDAVTGATKYFAKIYENYNLMADDLRKYFNVDDASWKNEELK